MTGIAILSQSHPGYADELERRGRSVMWASHLPPADVPSPEVVLADPNLMGELARFEGLKWIQSTWAGLDSVEWNRLPVAVTVCGLPGVFGPQMREFVMAHLLAGTHRTHRRSIGWESFAPGELRGSRLGILGAGSIGGFVADAARAFGMEVVGCSRTGAADDRYEAMYPVEGLHEFADGLDHLVAILPATTQTASMIDAELLSRLNPGATFINVGRGTTAVTDDVVAIAERGHLSRVVLDVTDPEPLPADHPAWGVGSVFITGHTAARSLPRDIVGRFVENLARHEAGESLLGVVDRAREY